MICMSAGIWTAGGAQPPYAAVLAPGDGAAHGAQERSQCSQVHDPVGVHLGGGGDGKEGDVATIVNRLGRREEIFNWWSSGEAACSADCQEIIIRIIRNSSSPEKETAD